MTMSERSERLKEQIAKDEAKLLKLQEEVKVKKEKLRELENAEIMNNLNALSAQGMSVSEIVNAIRNNDIDVLVSLMASEENNNSEKSGTSSAFSILKEDEVNE